MTLFSPYVSLQMCVFSVNEIIEKQRRKADELKRARRQVESDLNKTASNLVVNHEQLDLPHVNFLLTLLAKKKVQLEQVNMWRVGMQEI